MEISKETVDKFNRAREEHLRKMKEDPEYRARYEETSRRLDKYYAFGTKPKE